MYARVTRAMYEPERTEDAARYVREEVMPRMQGQSGFKGFYQLIDRQSGRALGISLWESREAMEATAEMARQMRSGAVGRGASVEPTAEEYEVAIQA